MSGARLLVVNPNTSAEMTEGIRTAAEAAAGSRAEVEVIRPAVGPESIESQVDEIVSAYWGLDAILRLPRVHDAYVVACFSNHPLIGALRELRRGPVVGIMEAALVQAMSLGHRFSIVTTSPRWRPLLEDAVRAYGLEMRCASVRTTGLAVLDVERLPAERVTERLVEEARLAVERDGAEVICLGCAGMAGFEVDMSRSLGVPVIDGVGAAVLQVIDNVSMGLETSKVMTYQPLHGEPPGGFSHGVAETYAKREGD